LTFSPEAAPRAHVQNPQVAEVRSFQPGFVARPVRQNIFYVRNDPGSRMDAVVRALQRYFNVRPRREPWADPRDEASVARHPQGLIQAEARWAQDIFYQFTDNGAAHYQFRPSYRLWAGALNLEFKGAGPTAVSAPAARAPVAAAENFGYDPAKAAQETQARINELLAAHQAGPPSEAALVGPPNMAENPYFDPAHAAQNAIRKMRALLSPDQGGGSSIGPPNMTDNPYFDPALAAQNAMAKMQTDLAGGRRAASPQDVQAGLERAQRIRDVFFRPGSVLESQPV